MKSTSHFAMGHLLYACLHERGIKLNRIAFVYGNIAPDYTPSMLVAPHFTKVCSKTVAELTHELSKYPLGNTQHVGAEYSKNLGIMCHYICDYFCFAHNRDFVGGLKVHAAYENQLDSFLRENCLRLLDVDGTAPVKTVGTASQLLTQFESSRENYCSQDFSFENDLCFAFNACVSNILSIVTIARTISAPTIETLMDDISASLKGFATGNCYIYRMFFFKNRNHNLFFLPDLMAPIGAHA